MLITNANLVFSDKIIKNSFLAIKDGRISNYGPMSGLIAEDKMIDIQGKFILPGFIDEHVHGTNGFDVMDGSEKALATIARSLPEEGVTSFLATTMCQSEELIFTALKNVSKFIENNNSASNSEAEILGIHLEGPFISCSKCGGQDKSFILEPTIDKVKKYNALANEHIKMITYAPEETNVQFTEYLSSSDIVPSAGHSNANFDQIKQHIKYGLTNVTHIFNAMSPLSHREPGLAFCALYFPELNVELIADGNHVASEVVDFIYKVKGSQGITLISDAMRAKNLADGEFLHGGQLVTKDGNTVTLSNGVICGSVLKIADAVKFMLKYCTCDFSDIVCMSSENPAKKLGFFDRKGEIAIGKDADLVVLDSMGELVDTFIMGKSISRNS